MATLLLARGLVLLGALQPVRFPCAGSTRCARAVLLAAEKEVEPPSVAECIEASFVPAVMGVSRGDVTELKLFIASCQGAHRLNEKVDALSTTMDALPVQSAGRALMPEEAAVRAQWIGLVYLTLDCISGKGYTDEGEGGGLVPDEMRDEFEVMVSLLVRAKREGLPLSELNLLDMAGKAEQSEAEQALLKQACRVVYLTLDNVESEREAGTRADSPKKDPPKPYIPGTGG